MAIVTGPQGPAAGAWRSHGSPLCPPGQEALGAPHTRQTHPRASALSVSAHQGADFLLFFSPAVKPNFTEEIAQCMWNCSFSVYDLSKYPSHGWTGT